VSARDLWSAVVLQAALDLEFEAYRTVLFEQAQSFFQAAGEWAVSRQAIADCLALHVNDLERLSRDILKRRAAIDGGPPVAETRPAVVVRRLPEPSPVVQPLRPPDHVALRSPVVRPPVATPPDTVVVPFKRAAPLERKLAPLAPANRKPRRGTDLRDRDWWIKRFMTKQSAT
jgi:hypothetical protein